MKKQFLLVLFIGLFGVVCKVYAQSYHTFEFRFVDGKDSFFSPWRDNEENLKRLSAAIEANRSDIVSKKIPVYVDGYCKDIKRAKLMANHVKSHLILHDGMLEEYFHTRNLTQSYQGSNNVVVIIITVPEQEEQQQQAVRQAEIQPQSRPESVTEEPQSIRQEEEVIIDLNETLVAETYRTGSLSLRTNLLYWLGGMSNFGAEWKPNDAVGIVLNGGYAPLASNSWKKNWGGWFVAPGVRLYMGEEHRWFIETQMLAGGYNLKLGSTGYQGTVLGGGLTAGHKIVLSDNFDMDFTLGVGYGQLKYDSYRHTDGSNIYVSRNVKKNTVIPVQAGVSLILKLR